MNIWEQIKKMKQAKKITKEMKHLKKEMEHLKADDILHKFGLEVQRSSWHYVLPAVGLFVAGFVVGAGVALLLTPVMGQELQEEANEHSSGETEQSANEDEKAN